MSDADLPGDDPLVDLVDTARYPGDPYGWHELVAATQRELAVVGCCVLPDFVRPALHETLRREGDELAPQAYYRTETVNTYNIAVDTPLPADHPGRITMRRGNAFVARDRIPPGAIIQRLYTSPVFVRFVAACFGLPELHPLADPLSGLTLNVITPGKQHPWHFDVNDFTVSMLTQLPDGGGEFQYCPNIRSAESENFGDVRAVVHGRGDHLVRTLRLRPGDLQLFHGRYALHRVSEVRGSRARHTAIFAYSRQPGVVGSVARTRQLFGRVLPEHLSGRGAAGVGSVRVDQLLD
ncbi:MAG: HalD/BesD family halogenase [Thermocrispum sp.]